MTPREALDVAREALQWIASRADRRPDGTYNYDRDTLRQRARDALARIDACNIDDAGSRLGSTTGHAGPKPYRDVSDELGLRDASSADES